jgi:hypothetical protein
MNIEHAAIVRERIRKAGGKTRYDGQYFIVTYPDGKEEKFMSLDDFILRALDKVLGELIKLEDDPETIVKSWSNGYKEMILAN